MSIRFLSLKSACSHCLCIMTTALLYKIGLVIHNEIKSCPAFGEEVKGPETGYSEHRLNKGHGISVVLTRINVKSHSTLSGARNIPCILYFNPVNFIYLFFIETKISSWVPLISPEPSSRVRSASNCLAALILIE